ncbi:hypothetical protein Tco_1543537 [Tanacetum coccineum]
MDALPSLLNKVTEALNKFAQVIESASTKAGDKDDAKKANLNKQQPIPTPPPITTTVTSSTTSSLQSPFLLIPSKSSSQLKGEHINKYKGKKAMSSKDAEEKGSKSDSNDTIHLTGFMVESSKKKKLNKFDFVTEGGDHVYLTEEKIKEQKSKVKKHKLDLHLGEWREVVKACPNRTGKGWTTIYDQIKTRMDYLHKTEVELGIDLERPLGEHDPLDKLNDLTRKKRKHVDDIHNLFRSTKKFKSSVQYGDHFAATVLNELILEIFFRLHQGLGLYDHAMTFSSLLLAEVDKRNLNPLKQMRAIEQLRQ